MKCVLKLDLSMLKIKYFKHCVYPLCIFPDHNDGHKLLLHSYLVCFVMYSLSAFAIFMTESTFVC